MIAQQSRYTSTIKQYYHLVFSKKVKMAEQSVMVRDISVKLSYKPEELYINQVYLNLGYVDLYRSFVAGR